MARLEQRDEALNRVGAAARVGDFDRAGRVLDSLQAASPDDEEVRRVAAQLAQGRDFFAAVSRANALRQEQKYDQAVAVLDSFAQSAPDQSVRAEVARVLLGKAYYLTNQGNIAAGRQALAVVLERDPGNAEAIRALADLQEITSRPPVPRRRAAPIERRRPEPSPYASPAPAAPVTPAVEEPAVAETGSGDTAQARILWEEGYKMLSEYSDTNAAESRWSGARQLAPAGSKYHQKATEWLKRIGRL
jgi:tetratricopeptide (TPR) repeat protein